MAGRGRLRASLAVAGAVAGTELAVALLRPRAGVPALEPVDAGEYFSDQEISRARAFRRPQLALLAAGLAVETGVLTALVLRPPRRLWRAAPCPVAAGALTGAGMSVALEAATLPIAAVSRRRSIAVGLATDPWRSWAADRAKSSLLGAGFAGAGGAAAVALMRRAPRGWWLPGSGLAVLAATALSTTAPLVLDPIFNRFTPLPDGPLRADVFELGRRAGVRVGEVFEVDASRRTTAANAYVTGLGPSKRVVLFDTLIRNFSEDETRLVIAHELAHVRHRDVPRGLLLLALAAPPALHAVARLAEELSGADGNGAGPSTLPALALALGVVGAPVGLIGNQLSRRIEARADAFALDLTDAPEAWISFERGITLRNLADPDPPAWLRALLGTHPSTVERIGIAAAYRRARATTGAPATA